MQRIVPKDVVRAASHEDAVALFGQVAYRLVMNLEQGIVVQAVESRFAQERETRIPDPLRLFVRLFKAVRADAAGFRCLVDQFLVVEFQIQQLAYDPGHLTAAGT